MGMKSKYGNIDIHVTVKTDELLERLKSNREKHLQEYERAINAWQDELKHVLASINAKQCFYFPQSLENLQQDCPQSHVDEYDQAIDMFTMCVKDEVTLDSESFNTFCRDDWGWKSYVSKNRFYRKSTLKQ